MAQGEELSDKHSRIPEKLLAGGQPAAPVNSLDFAQVQEKAYLAEYNRMINTGVLHNLHLDQGDGARDVTATSKGVAITAKYDKQGKMSELDVSGASGETHKFNLDKQGNVVSRSESFPERYRGYVPEDAPDVQVQVKRPNSTPQTYQTK